MKLMWCPDGGCDNTVYVQKCGHILRVNTMKHALAVINAKDSCKRDPDAEIPIYMFGDRCEPARNFVFQRLYEARSLKIEAQKTKKTKQVQVTKDIIVEEDEFVYIKE